MDNGTTALGGPANPSNRNARVAHIRKFVCVPPDRGAMLRLVTLEAQPTVLGEWPRTACQDNGTVAEDVDAMLREHANAVAAELSGELQANLIWQGEDGTIVCSKRLKCRAEITMGDPASIAQAEALGIVGTQQGWMLQSQREREVMMRSYFSAHQVQINQYNVLVQTLGNIANEQMLNAHRAQLELDRLRAQQRRELDGYAMQVREAGGADSAESGARAELINMVGNALTQALPFIVQHVGKMMTDAPANANTAPAPAAAAE